MHIINQPWGGREQRMGDVITRLLTQDSPRFEIFRACVAFAKASGVLRLIPALQTFQARGGRVEIVLGVDEGITTRQALELVMKYSTTAYVFNNPVATFHPKLYLFELPGKHAVAFIGSSNLTTGGLYTNYEANLGLEFDLTAPLEREAYENMRAIFTYASDTATGNAKILDANVLEELIRARRVVDETRPMTRRRARGRAPVSKPSLFPRTPVPPAPRIAGSLVDLIPRIKPTGDVEADQQTIAAFLPWEMFVMILGTRDTRQITGYSRDVYIPLAARDRNPTFWGWPAEFQPGSDATRGKYQERRLAMLVRPVAGQTQVVDHVRLYYYDIKHEFRLNCGRLIQGARPGDLLVIQRSPVGALFEGQTYQYEATVLSAGHPDYRAFVAECRNQVPRSPKRWGYL